MYSFVRNAWLRKELFGGTLIELVALTVSFLIAETFYKFHSFTLECGAFLVTWFLIGMVLAWVSNAAKRLTVQSCRSRR